MTSLIHGATRILEYIISPGLVSQCDITNPVVGLGLLLEYPLRPEKLSIPGPLLQQEGNIHMYFVWLLLRKGPCFIEIALPRPRFF